MMNDLPIITDRRIENYCKQYSSTPGPLLKEVAAASEVTKKTKMLSGDFLGQFLKLFSLATRPKYILEIGTFTGYGTLCFLEGLHSEGQLVTMEKDDFHYDLSAQNFEKLAPDPRIIHLKGDARELIPLQDKTWDLVFLDAGKRHYGTYFDLVLPQLRSGGVILADNVLWKGKVGRPDNDKLGLALDAFNQKVFADDRVENIILPIDDGVNFIIKV